MNKGMKRLLRLLDIEIESFPFPSFRAAFPLREAVLCLDCDHIYRQVSRQALELEEVKGNGCPNCGSCAGQLLTTWVPSSWYIWREGMDAYHQRR